MNHTHHHAHLPDKETRIHSGCRNCHADHHSHHEEMLLDFRRRFIVSTALTVPVLLLSPMVQGLLGFSIVFLGDEYLLFLLSSVIFFWGGAPFLRGFWEEMRHRRPGMMTLVAIAITVAYVYSSAVVFGLKGRYFFWELVTLIDLMLFGHWIEMRSVLSASRALQKLVEMMPDRAYLIKDGGLVEVEITDLK